MAILNTELQSKIEQLIDLGNEEWETNRETYYKYLFEAWNLYPNPKNQWNKAYSLAKEIFDAFLIDGNIIEAKKWLNEMIQNNNNLHLMDFDLSFNIGKFHFENNEFEKAIDEWQNLVSQTKFRYFEGEDKEYLTFVKNPEKYIKK